MNQMAVSNIVKAKHYAPHLPWNVTEADDLGPAIIQHCEDCEPFFKRWAEKWFENFQFLYGNQAVKWSRRWGFAVDYDFLSRQPSMNQRAQTNLARVVCEALASLIYSNLPTWEVESSEESSIKGKRYKKIVQKLLDAYMYRLNMDKEFQLASLIYTAFGQVGAEINWKSMAGKILEVPRMRKVKSPVFTTYMAPNQSTMGLIEVPTGAMTSQGQPMFEDRWEYVVDQMGRQVIDRMFAGDAGIDILTPFEYSREIGSDGFHKTKYGRRLKLMDFDEYLDEYGELQGKTKHFYNIAPVENDATIYAMAVRYFMRMQFTTPPTLQEAYNRPDNVFRSQLFRGKVLVIEHYDRPHPKKWPMGRRVVVVNGLATHITVPSYSTNKMDGWHPFVEAQWMVVKPSSIASGPLNDVISKNREFNVKKSLTATALRRNMGSILLLKNGSGIDQNVLAGEPGQSQIVADPFGARWLHDDQPLPAMLPTLEQQDKDEIYEVSGAMDALRGDRSKGVTSGYHAKQIEEREEKRLAPARKNFETGLVAGMGEKLVACIKANVKQLDDAVMGYMKRAAAGEFKDQDVIGFLSSPIDFGVDITIKKGSMALKSVATEQATAQELANGVANMRVTQDAKVLDKYLDYFGLEVLRDGSSKHRERAQRENEAFIDLMRLGPNAEGTPRPVVLFEDDDNVHGAEHDEFMIEHAEELLQNEWLLIEFLTHKARHDMQRDEKAAKLAPGSSLQAPSMMAQARQIPAPNVQMVQQGAMMKQQQQQQQGAQGQPPGQGQPPQAPSLPAPGGSNGPRQTDPAAPSQNTPSAASRGGQV